MLLWAGEFSPQAIFGTTLRGTTQALDNPGIGVKFKEAVTLAIGNGAMCWLTSMPIIASTTGIVSLAGMIASLLAQTAGKFDDYPLLCALACEIHGYAGSIAAERYGSRGVMATDIIDAIGLASDAVEERISFPDADAAEEA